MLRSPPSEKLEWVDLILKKCACGVEFKNVCECEHLCNRCSFLHKVEQPQAGPHNHYVPKSKYNMKFYIRKQLQRFDLTEDQQMLVVMRPGLVERLWYNLLQSKLITLDFILSRIFTPMGLAEQSQQCAPIREKTLVEYEQLWESIVDLIHGW